MGDGIIGFRMKQWKTQTNLYDWIFGRNAYWLSGDNMLCEATPKCCRERLRSGLAHLAKVHLVAVVGEAVEPLSPGRAVILLARQVVIVGLLTAPVLLLIRKLKGRSGRSSDLARRKFRLLLSLLLGGGASLISLWASGVRRANFGERLVHSLQPFLYRYMARPSMRLMAH